MLGTDVIQVISIVAGPAAVKLTSPIKYSVNVLPLTEALEVTTVPLTLSVIHVAKTSVFEEL